MKKQWQKVCLSVLACAAILNAAFAEETNHLSKADELVAEGCTLFIKGDLDKAITDFTTVIQFDPTNALAIWNRASAYRAKGEFEKSIADFNEYILLNPTNDLAFKNRASDFMGIGNYDKAISDWNEGLRLKQNDAIALAMRGDCYEFKGQFNEARKDFYQAIRLDAKGDGALNSLAWFRATCPDSSMRNGKEAVEAAQKACELSNWKKWGRIDTLVAAFAEAGDFLQAIKYQQQALNMNEASDKEREAMQNRLSLYHQQKPYRETYSH